MAGSVLWDLLHSYLVSLTGFTRFLCDRLPVINNDGLLSNDDE